jgi:hypothetical protein
VIGRRRKLPRWKIRIRGDAGLAMAARADVRRAAAEGRGPPELYPVWWLGVPLALEAAIFGTGAFFSYFHWNWMMGELGLMEQAQFLTLAIALVVAIRLVVMPEVEGRPWLRSWLVLAVIGCLYTLGEEASYGQHIIGWATPESWRAINQQHETNLHNVDNWFGMKPRFLLELRRSSAASSRRSSYACGRRFSATPRR